MPDHTLRRVAERAPDEHKPIPQLMLEARGSYGNAIRAALAEIGCEDMPRRGGFVLTGLLDDGESFTRQSLAVRFLGLRKQTASQLIDTLVVRGYLERRSDPEDRRHMSVRLTERGRAAAGAIQTVVDAIDARLAQRITREQLDGLRTGLAALAQIREEGPRERE